MPRPRTGRQRVEDCLALRAADIMRPDGLLGRDAIGSAEVVDPASGAPVGTVSWQIELFDGWGDGAGPRRDGAGGCRTLEMRAHTCAGEMAWREDKRRVSDGNAFRRTLELAMTAPVSRQWKGYWERNEG